MLQSQISELLNKKITRYRLQGYDLPTAGNLAKREIMQDPRIIQLPNNGNAPQPQNAPAPQGTVQQPAPPQQNTQQFQGNVQNVGGGMIGNMFASAVVPSLHNSMGAEGTVEDQINSGDYYISKYKKSEATKEKADVLDRGNAMKAQTDLPPYQAPDIGYPYVAAGYLGANLARNLRNYIKDQNIENDTAELIKAIDKSFSEEVTLAKKEVEAMNEKAMGDRKLFYNDFWDAMSQTGKVYKDGLISDVNGKDKTWVVSSVLGYVSEVASVGNPGEIPAMLEPAEAIVFGSFDKMDEQAIYDYGMPAFGVELKANIKNMVKVKEKSLKVEMPGEGEKIEDKRQKALEDWKVRMAKDYLVSKIIKINETESVEGIKSLSKDKNDNVVAQMDSKMIDPKLRSNVIMDMIEPLGMDTYISLKQHFIDNPQLGIMLE